MEEKEKNIQEENLLDEIKKQQVEQDGIKISEPTISIVADPDKSSTTEREEESITIDTDNKLIELEKLNLELLEKLAIQEDKILRTQAEIQNSAKRNLMELEKIQKFSLERFARDLLVVVDTLEMALKHSDKEKEQETPELKTYREGVELTLKSFIDTLKKFHIVPINMEKAEFNPEFHEAIQVIEGTEHNKVIDVVNPGYMLHDRVIRPAMVVVSKVAKMPENKPTDEKVEIKIEN